MENQHREIEFARRVSQQSQMDGFTPMDSITDDPFILSALMSLDDYPEFYNPLSYSSSPFSCSPTQQVPTNWASPGIETANGNNASDENINTCVPKSLPGISLADRMLRALSLFKKSSGGGILAQVWMPIRDGSRYVLSTSDQPFLFDQILAGYREISRDFTFSAEEDVPGLLPGLPGRVFISGLPEWTSNVGYYKESEYLRADFAHSHAVRGSLAVPIFDAKGKSCFAVLELVTMTEKADFDVEMDSVCNALQAVELRTSKAQAYQKNLTKHQKSALAEILDVLRACCHAHMLPLALTWVPICCNTESTSNSVHELNSNLRKKNVLSIQQSACYVNDPRMKGFLHACSEQCLEKGQGIAGKALQSNQPFFSPDVKIYDIREYPLAHHARKYGLHAAVAIRLRSTFTGNDDYILEFFLPMNCRGSSEQQELLNNLSNTMQRICRSLRTVSDAEVTAVDSNNGDLQKQVGTSPSSPEISVRQPQHIDSDNETSTNLPFEEPNSRPGEPGDTYYEQFNFDSTKQPDKKRNTAEKNISLNVLRQYFSGSLKDAAKSVGVCPTTLKRICRQHGISRWPSRKINKVNRSLKKIQNVINSVQGVEGALKYDPTTGCIVSAVSSLEKSTTTTLDTAKQATSVTPSSSTPDYFEPQKRFPKNMETSPSPNNPKCETDIAYIENTSIWPTHSKDIDLTKEHSHPSSSSMTDSSSGSASSCPTFKKCSQDKISASDTENVTAITVKAAYKGDTVRFKFVPTMGCQQLFKEIGKRYKLSIGMFQLKYMDDEDEWVILASESDLQECVEVLESMRSRNLKLLVRDVQCSLGSSGGSNFLQA